MMSSSWLNRPDALGRLQAVFLDRDGVINRDSPDYVTAWEDFEFLPGSLSAIAALSAAAIDVIIVTNQSALARGLMTPNTLADIHRRLTSAVAERGGRIRAILHCPHHPDDLCGCRKPAPGMILQAQARFGLDLKRSVMIGDRATDVACGRQAGCGGTILVRSGLHDERPQLQQMGIAPDLIVDDLAAAVSALLDRRGHSA
ncbi:MAG: D-glycero-beta-D-manno-heptose 1,7-bisphosphate 7-phosphatase [Desulfobacterales bacterium]|nr:D-glycero-beta-D-manno-heptose 1,7-bisphosphate 7-phosphatase [Desulfobacterales bacterium]